MHINRKVRGFTSDEFRLWMMAISYSRKHKTRGFLTEEDALDVANGQRLRRPKVVIASLTDKHGFDHCEGGYRIHDWDDMPYDRIADAGRAGGVARAQTAARSGGRFTSSAGEVLDQRDTSDPPGTHQPRAGTPPPTPTPKREIETPNGVSKESQRVFDTWAASKGNTPGLRLTSDRERLIRARLREGYSVEDLEAAACGWQNDPWEGRAQQNDLKYLLRNGGMVEKFRDLWRNGPPTPALFKPDGSVARSQARVRAFEALADTLEHPQLSEGA